MTRAVARFVPETGGLLVVDMQHKLAAAMPTEPFAAVERNAAILVELAHIFDMPVVVTEQYPRGLGPTTDRIGAAVSQLAAHRLFRLEKREFSVCDAADFGRIRAAIDRSSWIVCGMEAHVCVYQTVRDLVAAGDDVHVVIDAVLSRSEHNRALGIERCVAHGATPTSTELVAFDIMRVASGDRFKAISRLLK